MSLSVPFFRQKRKHTCGPAVLKMAFAFFGKKVKEEELTRKLKTDVSFGTFHRELIRVARDKGFFVYVNHGSNLGELEYLLKSGLPPIVHFTEPYGEEGHYAVVTALTKRYVILNDPWNGPGFRLTRSAFIRRWKHRLARRTFIFWVMAVSPKLISVGRIYVPRADR